LLVVATGATARDYYDLPSIGQPANAVMSLADEARIGTRVVTQLRANGALIQDSQLSEYINRVGHRLARHTGRAASSFHFYVVNSQQVNAFALPGGYIGVNAGLIMDTETESELAAVMAHECAHVTQRHIARQILQT